MPCVASLPVDQRFHKVVWGASGVGTTPAGLIVGGADRGMITMYDADKLIKGEDNALVFSKDKHTGPVAALDFNPFQSNLLASGGSESELYIWDVNKLGTPMTPGAKSQPLDDVRCVAWNRQVQHILASTFSSRCVVWDLRKDDPIIKVSDSTSRMRCKVVSWDPDVATQLCIASEDDHTPVIQIWDLRLATSPLKTMKGHHKGVLSVAWCQADSDLLLSCGKDNRILVWNPNSGPGEIVAELPTSNQWSFDVSWCPRNPAIIASANFDGRVSLYSLMGRQQQVQPSNKVSDSFGPCLGKVPNQTQQTPQGTCQLKSPSKWLRRPCGATFGFGGKLVSFETVPGANGAPVKPAVYISSVVTQVFTMQDHEDERSLTKDSQKHKEMTDPCEWDIVEHISEAEKTFRKNTNSKAIQSYFCANEGLLARNLEAKNKGLMTWNKRDIAAKRLSVGCMGNLEKRIWREWDLLKKVEEDDEKFVAIKKLINMLSNVDVNVNVDTSTKAKVFHALNDIGLTPCVFFKLNLLPEGLSDYEVVVLVPDIISAVRMNGSRNKVVAEAKSKFVKDLVGKFKEDEEDFTDWLRVGISERAEWSAQNDKVEVVLHKFVPANIHSIDGWIVFKSGGGRKKPEKKLEHDSIRWAEKMERNEINRWIAGCRLTEIGTELWTISESVWPELEMTIIARWTELLQDFPILGVDFEGGGCVGQFALASHSGISTFVFIGGFFPTTLTRLIIDVLPIIIGSRYELSKYLGGCSGLSSLDPLIILRDVQGMGSGYGIADLAQVCLGLDLHRLKKVGALCEKKHFSDLTLSELQYGFVRCSDWYQREDLTNEQSYYAALDSEVLLRAIILAMWLETTVRQFSYTEEVITLSTILNWWKWARDLSCNKAQLQRISSTEAGMTVRESRLAYFGKIHFYTHARGKEFAEEEIISYSGTVNENIGEVNRSRALINEHGISRSILWENRQRKRKQEISRRLKK